MSEQDVTPTKYGAAYVVSRELGLLMGLVEPTAEERAEMEERHRLYVIEENRRALIKEAAIGHLRQIEVEPVAALIALHGPVARQGCDTCEGCDMSGYEAEAPEWPCRTIQAIAAHYRIELP